MVDWGASQAELIEIFWRCSTAEEVRAAALEAKLHPDVQQWLAQSANKPLEVACTLVSKWGIVRE